MRTSPVTSRKFSTSSILWNQEIRDTWIKQNSWDTKYPWGILDLGLTKLNHKPCRLSGRLRGKCTDDIWYSGFFAICGFKGWNILYSMEYWHSRANPYINQSVEKLTVVIVAWIEKEFRGRKRHSFCSHCSIASILSLEFHQLERSNLLVERSRDVSLH